MAIGVSFAVALVVPASVAGLSGAAESSSGRASTRVSSIEELSEALADAAPGDTVLLAAGRYTSGTIRVGSSGTEARPITVAAAETGSVVVAGSARFDLSGASNVVVRGFTVENRLKVPVDATAVRITRNTFQGDQSGAFLDVGSDDSEIDHNAFLDKSTEGVYLQISGPGDDGIAQRAHIHHNLFSNHQFAGENGGESVRIGLSSRQKGDAQALVEQNLFEKADGDVEAISIKSSNNVIRQNTLVDSRGTITLRHGDGSTVDGNIVLGGASGIRVFGNDHTIVNNVVQDSSGLPLEVGGGEIKDDTDSTTDHDATDDSVVAFNTFVGTGGRVVKYGSDREFAPSAVTFAGNILVGDGGDAVTGEGEDLTFQNNILSGAAGGTLPADSFTAADPRLVRGSGDLFRLNAGSPAIGAGPQALDATRTDIDGQDRGDTPDAGADQFDAATPVRPLTRDDVGPAAP